MNQQDTAQKSLKPQFKKLKLTRASGLRRSLNQRIVDVESNDWSRFGHCRQRTADEGDVSADELRRRDRGLAGRRRGLLWVATVTGAGVVKALQS